VATRLGIIPGIKVVTGAKDLAGSPGIKVTEGLDGLRDRLRDYYKMGTRFAKWRAVIRITDRFPSPVCLVVNAHALGACRTLGIDSEKVPERGQILTIFQAQSGTMGQEGGEIWTA
jgi:fructose-bisphosphate aldolase class I